MIEMALEPFTYTYMARAIWLSALVGGACAFLSSYLMLKGWSLVGDALAHAVVPGVAMAYILQLPYAFGAFLAGILAASGMAFINQKTKLREDAIIGLVFTAFFAAGLLIVSINPLAVNIEAIILGNVLAISNADAIQVVLITLVSIGILLVKWRDLVAVFFDEAHAQSLGLPVTSLKILFFTLLSACAVAALQTVGACLVIAMVITPGATAYLLTDRFGWLIALAVAMGVFTSGTGAYASYFINASPGGLIVTFQTLVFFAAFFFAPKHGVIAGKFRERKAVRNA